MSRYRKGFVALWIMVVAFVFVALGVHILVKMHVLTNVIKVKGEVDIYLDLDDKGTEALSFLSSQLTRKDYMEILGSLTAKGADKILLGGLNRIENTLNKVGKLDKDYYLIVRDSSGNTIYEKKKGTPTDVKIYKLGNINLVWPVEGKPVISSGFGYRKLGGKPDFHGGIDIAVPGGTEVFSAAEGNVVRIGRGCTAAPTHCVVVSDNPKKYNHGECGCGYGMGNYVVIKHHKNGETFYTFYVHLMKVESGLKEGDKVSAKALMGLSGNTGYSKGAHLHFELGTKETKGDATAVDPCPYLPNAPLECEQPSHRVGGYEVGIPLPGGERGEVEMVIW